MDAERILNTLFTLSHFHSTFDRTALAEEQVGNVTGKSNKL